MVRREERRGEVPRSLLCDGWVGGQNLCGRRVKGRKKMELSQLEEMDGQRRNQVHIRILTGGFTYCFLFLPFSSCCLEHYCFEFPKYPSTHRISIHWPIHTGLYTCPDTSTKSHIVHALISHNERHKSKKEKTPDRYFFPFRSIFNKQIQPITYK